MKRSTLKAASLAGAAIALGLAFVSPLRVVAQQTICAVVKLQIQQQATLEREGFDANLQVNNSLTTQPLTNLKVQIFIKDAAGNSADNSFFVKISSLTGTAAVDGTGVVQSSASAVIDWLIIPSSGTGGTNPAGQQYAVTALITAISNGTPQNITTFPATITVHPQPVIKLEYALPYEVFGQEPLLLPVITPVEPYPLAVRATNIGFGTANNFQIQSAQPQIVDNKQGLAVDFKLLGTVVNGQTIPNTLLIPFGNVAPNQVSQAAWVMASSLSGRFISFTSTFTHAADLGGNLTSLLQSVTTYTLLKDVLVDLPGRDQIPDFLVNETQDRGTMQTMLDAGIQPPAQYILESDQPNPLPVAEISGAVSGVLNGANAALTFAFTQGVSSNVWVHSYAPFSYGNTVVLASARRADGKVINPANVWISKHFNKTTLSDVYWINILDLTSSTNTYVIQFNPSSLVIPPGQVVDLAATHASDGGDAALTWTAPGEGGNSGFLFGGSYLFEAETSSSAVFAPSNAQLHITTSTPPGVPQVLDMNGLIGNSTYYFHMWTQNGGGAIAALSNAATGYTLPNPPSALLFTVIGSTFAAGDWRVGNNALPIFYQVSAATAPGGVAVSSSPLQDSFSSSYTFDGLVPNTTFYFSGVGLSTVNAVASPPSPLGPVLTLAAPPDSVQLVASGTGTVTAVWSTDANPPGTQFLVELSTAPGLPPLDSSGWLAASSFTFTGVAPQYVYSGRVKARNSALVESSYSQPGTAAFASAISPAAGAGGSVFSISGANFGVYAGTASTRVQFGAGGPLATVTSWNDFKISGTVPALSSGSYSVLVERQSGATVATISAGTFTVGAVGSSSGPVVDLSPFDGDEITTSSPTIVASYTDSIAAISTASVRLSLDGVDVTTQSLVAASSATFTPIADLSEGTHTVTASVADAAAFVSTASATFLVDTIPPVTSLLVDGTAAVSTAPVVVSTDALGFAISDAGSGGVDTVYIVDADFNSCDFSNYVSTAPSGTCANPYYSDPFTLAAGTHTLSFYSDDDAGNSEDLNVVTVLVRQAPSSVVLTLSPADGSAAPDPFPTLTAFYNDDDPTTAVDTTTVRLSLDGVDVTTQSLVAVSSATFDPVAEIAEGTHTFAASAADFAGNSSTAAAAFLVDTIPPVTTLAIDGRPAAAGAYAVTSTDTLSLSATDAGSGVSGTFYVVDADPFSPSCDGTPLDPNAPSGTCANETYNGPFTLTGGTHAVYYFSEDLAGNQEPENVSSFTVLGVFLSSSPDGVASLQSPVAGETLAAVAASSQPAAAAAAAQRLAPATSFYDLSPSGIAFSSGAILSFSFNPGSVSTATLAIYTFNGVSWDSSSITNQRLTNLSSSTALLSGTLAHASLYGAFSMSLDILPPRTSLVIGAPVFVASQTYISSSTPLGLSAVDDKLVVGDGAGVGVANTFYAVDGASFTAYSGTFNLVAEGTHTISFYSVDLASNVELVKSTGVSVDLTAPISQLQFVGPASMDWQGGFVLSTSTLVGIAAADPVSAGVASGVNQMFFGVDGAAPTAYQTPFVLTPGFHTISYFAVDNIGNAEAPHTTQVSVGTPPLTGVESAAKAPIGAEPQTVAVDLSSNVYVNLGTRILKLSSGGQLLTSWGTAGSGAGQLGSIDGMRVGPDGNLYASDSSNHVVHVFGPSGTFLADLTGGFHSPIDVAFDSSGQLNVLDISAGKIFRTKLDGTPVATIPVVTGLFGGLAIDSQDNMYVANFTDARVHKYTAAGLQLLTFGGGSGAAALTKPRHLDIDSGGRIHVVDWFGNRIAVYSSTGAYIGEYGTAAENPDAVLNSPVGIAILKSGGRVWISPQSSVDQSVYQYVLDTTPPSPPVLISPKENSRIYGTNPMVVGRSKTETKVMLFDSGLLATATTVLDLSGLFALQVPLSVGSHHITAQALTNMGYTSPLSAVTDVTLVAAPPAFSFGSPLSFQIPTSRTGNISANETVVGDFNGDGNPDIFVIGGQGFDVLLGDGKGGFTKLPAVAFPSSGNFSGAVRVYAADLNKDGKLDVVILDYNGGLRVMVGNGDGTFGDGTYSSVVYISQGFPAGYVPLDFVLADINNDGNMDIITTDGHNLGVLLGRGDPGFTFTPQPLVPTGLAPTAGQHMLQTADFNKDGKLDVVMSGEVFFGNGNGGFSSSTVLCPTCVFPLVGDFNQDGNSDVALFNGNGSIDVFLGLGDGTFKALPPQPYIGGDGAAGTVGVLGPVPDLNGDGVPDLAYGGISGNVNLFPGRGDGLFGTPQAVSFGNSCSYIETVSAADFKHSGTLNLVSALNYQPCSTSDLSVLLNQSIPLGPATVSDLRFSAVSLSSAALAWTAPSDPSLAVVSYDIRSATFALTASNFASGTPVSAGTTPGAPGSAQSANIALSGQPALYFALESADSAGRISAISNVAGLVRSTGTVAGQPELTFFAGQPVSETLISTMSSSGMVALATAASQGLVLASSIYDLGPEGAAFAPPATLTLSYSTAVLAGLGVAPTNVGLYQYVPGTGMVAVSTQTLNAAAQTVTGSIPSLSSIFALFGKDTTPPVTTLWIDSRPVVSGSFNIKSTDTLSLSATDAGSGVSGIFYVIDTYPFTPACEGVLLSTSAPRGTCANDVYGGAFTLTAGTHTVYYFSKDYANNQEAVNAASFTVTSPPTFLTSLSVAPSSAVLSMGGSAQFQAVGMFSDGSTQSVTALWASDAPAVATVTLSGLATGLSSGTAHVIASSGTFSGSASVTVQAPSPSVASIVPNSGGNIGLLNFSINGSAFENGTSVALNRVNVSSGFINTGAMITPRDSADAALLLNGKVLVAGGANSSGGILATAEIYDPASGTWSQTGSMSIPRITHSMTLLKSGKVLVAGGRSCNTCNTPLSSAELFDPASGLWSPTASMNESRFAFTATALPDGRVLAAGGGSSNDASTIRITGEVYDPATGTWTEVGSMSSAHYGHAAALMSNGSVIIAGGRNQLENFTNAVDIFNPTTNQWSVGAPMPTIRSNYSLIPIKTGKVLAPGGGNGVNLSSADLYDPVSNSWSAASAMPIERISYTATTLTGGNVLMVGGFGNSGYVPEALIYDPVVNAWTSAGNLPLLDQTATLLGSGNVLIAGGFNNIVGEVPQATLYVPSLITVGTSNIVVQSPSQLSGTFDLTGAPVGVWDLAVTNPDGQSGVLPSGFTVHDATPPNAVSDLAIATLGVSTATLTWTAPSQGGTVASYDLRRATFPITSANFLSATSIPVSAPGAPGSLQTGSIALGSDSSIFVAIRSQDSYGDVSSLSNVASLARSTISINGTPEASIWATQPVSIVLSSNAVAAVQSAAAAQGLSQISSLYDANPQSIAFAGGANAVFVYDPAVLAALGVPLSSLQVYQFSAGALVALSSESVLGQTVYASTASFTGTLGLFGVVPAPTISAIIPAIGGNSESLAVSASGSGIVSGAKLSLNRLGGGSAGFQSTGAMITPRIKATAVQLANGKVLVAGGQGSSSAIVFASAEIFDPTSGNWAATGAMAVPRFGHTMTLLPNGKVLVAGGSSCDSCNTALNTAEIYDPASGTWSYTGSLAVVRISHTAALLPNGKVLVAGGGSSNNAALIQSSAELYDPATGVWSAAGTMPSGGHYGHAMAVLADGRALVAGGRNSSLNFTSAVDVYDPSANSWSAATPMNTARGSFTLNLLPNGKLLAVGGDDGTTLTSTELYDPVAGVWTPGMPLSAGRTTQTAARLTDGTILVIGGGNASGAFVSPAELYDPAAGSWSTVGNLPRLNQTETLLADGRVLIAGGFNSSGLSGTSIYDPASLSILASSVTYTAGTGIGGLLDLTGQPIGLWDVVITNPNHLAARLPNAFTIHGAASPSTVSDLSISSISVSTVSLQWTAPVSPSGALSSYEIRYTSFPMTAANFSAGTLITGPPPASAGTVQSVAIGGLSGVAGFYAGLQSQDIYGDVSSLSNIASLVRSTITVGAQAEITFSANVAVSETLLSTTMAPGSVVLATSTAQGLTLVSSIYDLGPEGAVFTPDAKLTFAYSTAALASLGLMPSDIMIYQYVSGIGMVAVSSETIDTVANTITGYVPSLSSIFAVFGVIKDRTAPVTSLATGTSATFTDGSGNLYASSSASFGFNAYDPVVLGTETGVAFTNYRVDGPSTAPFSRFTSTFSLATGGQHILFFYSADYAGNVEIVRSSSVAIDVVAPITQLAYVGGRQFAVPGAVYASSDTDFAFNAVDPPSSGVASGVAFTRYRDGTGAFQVYSSSFALAEGAHPLGFQTQDNVGNLELLDGSTIFVDATPPVSSVSVGSPSFTASDGTLYIGTTTPVAFTAADPALSSSTVAGSGVNHIEVAVDTTTFTAYGSTLSFAEGRHAVLYRAVDNVGNVEATRTLLVQADATPPTVQLQVLNSSFTDAAGNLDVSTASVLTLLSADPAVSSVASGVRLTQYQVGGDSFTIYAGTFTLAAPDGPRQLAFQATDNVGNTSLLKGSTVFLDATAPVTALIVGAPQFASSGTVFVSTLTPFSLASQDPTVNGVASGVRSVFVVTSSGAFTTYAGTFTLTAPDGARTLSWYAADNVGNAEAVKSTTTALDATPPVTTLSLSGGRQFQGVAGFYTSSDTRLVLNSTDPVVDGVDSGLAFTRWQDNGGVFQLYASSAALAEGSHAFGYQSSDNVQNLEVLRSTTVLIDATPPVSAVAIGSPTYTAADGAIYVATSTPVSFSAADPMLASSTVAGSGVARVEISLDGAPFVAYGSARFLAEGQHTILYRAIDNVGNVEAARSIALQSDATPPQTALAVSTPSFGGFVSSTTLFTLSAVDPSSASVASGVASTRYRINGGAFDSYSSVLRLSGADGAYTLDYQSLDNVGNVEVLRSTTVLLDQTPPVTTPHVGLSSYTAANGMLYVTPATPMTFTAVDPSSGAAASGVAQIQVAVDSGSFALYTATLTFAEGGHIVYFRAVDNVGNVETARALTLNSDATPPVTALAPSATFYAADGRNYAPVNFFYALPANDPVSNGTASGLDFTRYALDGGAFQAYVSTFGLAEGVYQVAFQSQDNVGNLESSKSATVYVDATPPLTALSVGAPQFIAGGTVFVSTATPFSLASQDPLINGVASGVRSVFVATSSGAFATYAGTFTLTAPDGARTLSWYAADNVGNAEAVKSTTTVLDATPPVTTLSLSGGRQFQGLAGFYASADIRLVLSSTDPIVNGVASGLAFTRWQDNGGTFQLYASSVTLAEGSHAFGYQSSDNVQNLEILRSTTVLIDATPPVSAVSIGSPTYTAADGTIYVATTALVSFSAADPMLASSTVAGSGVARIEVSLDSAPFTPYAATLTFAEGRHTILYRSIDNVGNVEAARSIALQSDATPPQTALAVSTPSFGGFVSSSTVFVMSAVDPSSNSVASGVALTRYRVNGGAFSAYSPALRLSGADGAYTLDYQSLDNVGNAEVLSSTTVLLDQTPPVTTLSLSGGRQFQGLAGFYASSDTRLVLVSTDPVVNGVASGLAFTRWQDNGGAFQFYASSVALAEGSHAFGYQSSDNVQNLEILRSTTILIDATPPVSAVAIGSPTYTAPDGTIYVATTTPVSFTAVDAALASTTVAGSGVNRIEVSIDSAPFATYAAALTFAEGRHTILYRAVDDVGNVEAAHFLALSADATPPVSSLAIGSPQFALSSATVLVSSLTPLGILAVDPVSNGVASGGGRTFYQVNGGTWTVFAASFTLAGTDGPQSVAFYSQDNVLNTEVVKSSTVLLDATPPEIALLSPATCDSGICRVVKGKFPVLGTARDLHFAGYSLSFAPGQNAATGYTLIGSGSAAVSSGTLAVWDASSLSGWQTLRLTATDLVGNVSVVSINVFVGDPGELLILGNDDVFNMPQGVAADGAGNIYVADTNANRIAVFTATGAFVTAYGQAHGDHDDMSQVSTATVWFNKPSGVAVDALGNIYAADTNNNRVLKLSATGQLLLAIGRQVNAGKGPDAAPQFQPGKGSGEFNKPSGVALDAAGNIYVADTNNNRVQVLNSTGAFRLAFSLPPLPVVHADEKVDHDSDQPSLGRPFGIAVDAAGKIYVADPAGGRALVFGATGQLLLTVPITGTTKDGHAAPGRPEGVAVSTDGFCLLVADRMFDRVLKFDALGDATLAFGAMGKLDDDKPAPGIVFRKPVGLALAVDGTLLVADRNNDRVERFGLPTGKPASVVPPTSGDDPSLVAKDVLDSASGGTVARSDKAGVTIPAGALPDDLKITVSTMSPASAAQADSMGRVAGGKGLAPASAPVEYGPEGTQFATPVTLTVPYDPSMVAASGMSEDSLKVDYWNKDKGDWETLDSTVDKAAHTVTAKTPHFSLYQVLGSTGTGIITPLAGADATFTFHDAYAFPNPVRGTRVVTIRMQTGLADSVEVHVYDITGRRLYSSSNFTLNPSLDDGNGKGPQYTYDNVWDISGVGSGVYTYVLTAKKGGASDIHKSGRIGVIK